MTNHNQNVMNQNQNVTNQNQNVTNQNLNVVKPVRTRMSLRRVHRGLSRALHVSTKSECPPNAYKIKRRTCVNLCVRLREMERWRWYVVCRMVEAVSAQSPTGAVSASAQCLHEIDAPVAVCPTSNFCAKDGTKRVMTHTCQLDDEQAR